MTHIGDQIKAKNSTRNNKGIDDLTRGHERRQKRYNNANNYDRRDPVYMDDGGDHINVWNHGRTDLGKALAFDTDIWVDLPGFGVFRSAFSLWAFLSTKRRLNALRKASPMNLRSHVNSLTSDNNFIDYPNIRYICAVAVLEHILRNKSLIDALILSGEAPLMSYIEKSDGTRYTHPQANWWIPTLRLIRATLISGQPINNNTLSVLKDNNETDDEIFIPIEEYIPPRLGVINYEQPKQEHSEPTKVRKKTKEKGNRLLSPDEYQEMKDSLQVNPSHKTVLYRFTDNESRRKFMELAVKQNIEHRYFFLSTEMSKLSTVDETWNFPLYVTVRALDTLGVPTIVSMSTAVFQNPFTIKPIESVKVKGIDSMLTSLHQDHGHNCMLTLLTDPSLEKIHQDIKDYLFQLSVIDFEETSAITNTTEANVTES